MTELSKEQSRSKILKKAEKLFAEKGYDATSLSDLAKACSMKKSSFYYYFKDKQDIVISLFNQMLAELSGALKTDPNASEDLAAKIEHQINFIGKKKNIFSVMLMEALKDKEFNEIFFHSTRIMVEDEMKELGKPLPAAGQKEEKFHVKEFFTGLMPVIMYAILEDKWCSYNSYDKNTVRKEFVKSFKESHISNHEQ